MMVASIIGPQAKVTKWEVRIIAAGIASVSKEPSSRGGLGVGGGGQVEGLLTRLDS